MKMAVILIFSLFVCLGGNAQRCPDWVKQRPVNSMYYTGIASVSRTESDYMEKAKTRALLDLASEIKVTVNANSLLKTLEQHGAVMSEYEESIKTQVSESLEKYELVETWQDDDRYWVYYQLNRFDYEEYMTARREKAIRSGYDYWRKGEKALKQGELTSAVDFFMKGLEAVRSVANEELITSDSGQPVDVGRELYASLQRVFNGVSVVAEPSEVEGFAFQGIKDAIEVRVVREDVPLKNVLLNAEFITGAGQVSGASSTDAEGKTKFYIRHITSKLSEQEIRVGLDCSSFLPYRKDIYKELIGNLIKNLPQSIVRVRIGKSQLKASLLSETSENAQIEQSVRRILTNHYFNIVTEPSEADVTVKIASSFRKGETVAGDMRDMTIYYAGVTISVVDNRNGAVVGDLALEDVKILQPSTASLTMAKSAAVRELNRRMQAQLNKLLSGIELEGRAEPEDFPESDF